MSYRSSPSFAIGGVARTQERSASELLGNAYRFAARSNVAPLLRDGFWATWSGISWRPKAEAAE